MTLELWNTEYNGVSIFGGCFHVTVGLYRISSTVGLNGQISAVGYFPAWTSTRVSNVFLRPCDAASCDARSYLSSLFSSLCLVHIVLDLLPFEMMLAPERQPLLLPC